MGAYPAPSAKAICPDAPLRLTFTSAPKLGASGMIHIVDLTTGKDADTIDLAAPVATKTIGGEPNFRYHPVLVSGTQAIIYPRNGSLTYGKNYAVVIEAGVFSDVTGAYGATDRTSWTFSTKTAGPAAGTPRLVVAADGSGDFCTVQGAIDSIPDGNTAPVTIFLRRGTYREIIFFTNKHALTFLGEDRTQTVIAYETNDRFNPTSGNPFGTNLPDPSAAHRGGHIYHRGVFLAHRVEDLVLANLTIRNTTPQGGSQAEAIILNGTTTARAILKDVDLYSYQDTLQINGQAFLSGCYLEGDVDFMWGTGPCYFENCTARTLRSGAYFTQIRNPGSNHGYVYVNCRFEGAKGIMGNYLSRIGTGRFPHSEVVLIDCTLTPAVHPVAWVFQSGKEGNDRDPAQVHFLEFNSHDDADAPTDTTFRLAGSKRLTLPTDAETITHYRNPTFVLGNEWNPKAAPIFSVSPSAAAGSKAPSITQSPVSLLTLIGTSASLTVAADGSGEKLTYQWFKDGEAITAATASTLRIAKMNWTDAGAYVAAVSNPASTVYSAAATLSPYTPQTAAAPDLPHFPTAVFEVTAYGAVADDTTDNRAAVQKAIDAAVAAGGGIVAFPPAPKPYRSGPLVLGSNVNLEVQGGAVLKAVPYASDNRPGAYPLSGERYQNFITANKAHDVILSGAGTIHGDGDAWWSAYNANNSMPHRPYLIRLSQCERVLLTGLTLTRSPMFHAAINADHLTVFGLTIDTPDAPNTDGLDPSGSHHLFQNCYISCGDDNLVMKPGGAFCSDITVTDCAFGEGHGMSVGGQSNRGLDGMLVKNCSFTGTGSGIRLKADPTQGGEVKNITYTNLTMDRVQYPIVFYSYYIQVGNPGSISGKNETTPEKVLEWNATPPNALPSATLPSWKNVTVTNVVASRTTGWSIIWGLPLPGYFIENVKFANVRLTGGPGLKVFNATNVQFSGETDVGTLVVGNALVITHTPRSQAAAPGTSATLAVQAAGPAGRKGGEISYQWSSEGQPLTDGPTSSGMSVVGARSPTLELSNVTATPATQAPKYAVTLSTVLDIYDPKAKTLAATGVPVSATTTGVPLIVSNGDPRNGR